MLNLTRVEVQMHPLALGPRPKVCVISSHAFVFSLTAEPSKSNVRGGGSREGGGVGPNLPSAPHLYVLQQVSRDDGRNDR